MILRPKQSVLRLASISLLVTLSVFGVSAQTTSFTYQGRLSVSGALANGPYDLQFALFDSLANGTQIGSTQTVSNVAVSAGVFSVQLDFGANAFPGSNRWLQISARGSGTQTFTPLAPRQQITATPYAIRSLNATSADSVTVVGLPPGSGNYIQNSSVQQGDSNFNISGDGTVGGDLVTNGNVGVGTTVASSKLTVVQSTSGPGVVATVGGSNIVSGTNTHFSDTFQVGDSISSSTLPTPTFVLAITSDTSLIIDNLATATRSNLTYQHPGGTRMVVKGNGNVGIGTATPTSRLSVVGNADVSGNLGIGTTTPQATLDVKGTGVFRPGGGVQEVSFGSPGGETGIVIKGPSNRADIRFNGSTLKLVAGAGSGPPSNANGLQVDTNGSVGIGTTPAPLTRLLVIGQGSNTASPTLLVENSNGQDALTVRDDGTVGIGKLGDTASAIHVCVDFLNTFTQCSSSLRFKDHVIPFKSGLELIRRLRPIKFTWKYNGTTDLGLGAEDVVKVEPLLVTYNSKGQIQGVKYDQLNVVLINAIKQQQEQIETLRVENAALNVRLKSVESSMRKHVRGQRK